VTLPVPARMLVKMPQSKLPQSWSTRTLLKRMRQKLERKLQQMPSPSQSNDVGVALFQRVADKVIIDEYSKVSLALVVEVKVLG